MEPLFGIYSIWECSITVCSCCVFVCLSVISDYSDCVEAGGGEGGGEGTWLPHSSAAQVSNTHLQTGPQHLQGTG